MDLNHLRALPYEQLRALYRDFLNRQNLSPLTIITASADTFYLWRHGSRELFWDTVGDPDFEQVARARLLQLLSERTSGDAERLVSSYLSHLRRFRRFLNENEIPVTAVSSPAIASPPKEARRRPSITKKQRVVLPSPSVAQVEHYLAEWDGLENYRLQEQALNRLFLDLCPLNTDILDVLLKASALNDFYSTHIYSIYPVARHIQRLGIDARLKAGDVTLVRDIQYVMIGQKRMNFYSFATKYCSHHNPAEYPIYDSYVHEVLRHFGERDRFSSLWDPDLKDYSQFKRLLMDFRTFYGLEDFSLKQIDQYIWLLGKEYFPRTYTKKKTKA